MLRTVYCYTRYRFLGIIQYSTVVYHASIECRRSFLQYPCVNYLASLYNIHHIIPRMNRFTLLALELCHRFSRTNNRCWSLIYLLHGGDITSRTHVEAFASNITGTPCSSKLSDRLSKEFIHRNCTELRIGNWFIRGM